jgi:hypothetical protein
MSIALWIVAGLLAVAYLGSGGMKLATAYDKLTSNPNMAWARDFSPSAVKGIGAAEILGAAGLILPQATGIAAVLTPVAASGLVLLQLGAMVTHARRKEYRPLPINIVLALLAAFVAIGRFAG